MNDKINIGDDMKIKFKLIGVVIISIFMLVGGLFFAINSKKETISYFSNEGYVINNIYDASKVQTNKEYFVANSAYRSHSDDKYSFKNTDGKKVTISEESFVHYSTGAIMALKDGVAIDLDKIDLEILNYYNIFEGSILSKKDTTYQINNLNDTIVFNKMLFKISDNKYLLAAKDIVISFSDGQTISTQDFIEIEYANEDVIRLYNDKVNYQTISSNLYIISDNIKIDVAYKTVSKNDVDLLAMVNMVINANDNIEIITKKDEIEDSKNNNVENGSSGGSGSGGSGNNIGTGGFGEIDINNNPGSFENSGNGEVEDSGSNEIIQIPNINPDISKEEDEEKSSFVQPKFNVSRLSVTTIGVSFDIEYEDPSEVLVDAGDRTVEIVENSTGNVIELDPWLEESIKYQATYSNLKSNSAYTINVRGQYIVDGEIFDRVFVSKIFRTTDLGLDIYTDYVTHNNIKFVVEKLESSDVTGFTYSILEKNSEEVCSGAVGSSSTINGEQSVVEFGIDGKAYIPNVCYSENGGEFKFSSNTNYTLLLEHFEYDNVEYADSTLQEKFTVKTLKNASFLSEISVDYEIDYPTNSLILIPKNVDSDINAGITGYTYKIYNGEVKDVNSFETPLIIREKDKSNKVVIDLSELKGNAGYDNFSAQLEVKFDDNEKTVIKRYTTSSITVGERKYPIVYGFKQSDETSRDYETISGTLTIQDDEGFLINETADYKIVLKEKSDPNIYNSIYSNLVQTQFNEGVETSQTIALPVDFIDVIPTSLDGESPRKYDLYVYVRPSSLSNYIYIGYETIETIVPKKIDLKLKNIVENISDDELFKFTVNLKEKSKTLINLDAIEFELDECFNGVCQGTGYKKIFEKSENETNEELENNPFYKLKCEEKESNGEPADCTITLNSNDFISMEKGTFKDENRVSNRIYKLRATGYGRNINGEYPIKVDLLDAELQEEGKEKEFSLVMKTPNPSINASYKKIVREDSQENFDAEVENNTIVRYDVSFNSIPNTAEDRIERIAYNVVELTKEHIENNNCSETFGFYDCICSEVAQNNDTLNNIEYDKAITDVLNLSVGKYGSNETIERGKAYCLIYKGQVLKENGEKKGDDVYDGISLRPSRQRVSLNSGYLKTYLKTDDGANIVFSFDVVDYDEAGTLSIGEGQKKFSECKDLDGDGFLDCEFKLNELSVNIADEIYLNLSQEITEYDPIEESTLYQFKLGDIQNFDNPTLQETSYIVNYGIDSENLEGQITLKIELDSSVNLNKILGAKIGTDVLKIKKEPMEDNKNREISIPISLYNIENNEAIEIKETSVIIDWSKIKLVYDSNEINFGKGDYFITKISNPNLYLESNTNSFKSELDYSDDLDFIFTTEFFEENLINFNANKTIGYNFVSDVFSERVHHHLIKLKSIADESEEYNVNIKRIPTTSKIITMYGEKNSYISFDCYVDNFDINKLKIYETGTNDEITVEKKLIDDKVNKVNIIFNNLSSALNYDIKYCESEDCSVITNTYNKYSAKNNTSLSISTIKDTDPKEFVNNFVYSYVSNQNWQHIQGSGEGTDEIQFTKNITISYSLKDNFYVDNGSTIDFEFWIAKNDDKGEPTYLGKCPDPNSCEFDLASEEFGLTAGNYKIILGIVLNEEKMPKQIEGTSQITISKTAPTPKIRYSAGTQTFSLNVNDSNGVLTSCFVDKNDNISYRCSGDPDEDSCSISGYEKKVFDSFLLGYNNLDPKPTVKGYLTKNAVRPFKKIEPINNDYKNFYNKFSDQSTEKMYYLLLQEDYNKSGSFASHSFAAIPFSTYTSNITWSDLKNNKNLGTGDYDFNILYCTKELDESGNPNVYVNIYNYDVNITDDTALELAMSSGQNSVSVRILGLANRDFIKNFDYIKYQIKYFDEPAKETTVINTADSNHGVRIESTTNTNSTYDLTFGFDVDDQYTGYDVEHIEIQLYKGNPNKDGMLFKTIEYEKNN